MVHQKYNPVPANSWKCEKEKYIMQKYKMQTN